MVPFTSTAISFESLTFTYRQNKHPALNDIQGEIGGGNFVVVMGHEGAGKSTLCYSTNALIPRFFPGQYQGRVVVKGQEVARKRVAEMSRHVGLVLQDFEAQLFSSNVELEMAFGPENHHLPHLEIERRIQRYLSLVGLEKLRRREPASLSGGEKQRLAIGSVLTIEPDILLMDEPATDLDPQGREEVLSVARKLKEEGHTILLVEHEPEIAVGADQVWLMRDGHMVAQESPAVILPDIPKLESCGVKPPATIELFSAMGWPGKPLTVESALSLIGQHDLTQRRTLNFEVGLPLRSGGKSILQAEGLEYVYPAYAIKALRGIDLQIQEGEFIAILGQNGSGKSTLAKHFNGLLKPTAGRMLVQGRPTTAYSHREMAEKVGYVFQNPDHQIFARTVIEEVEFSLKMLGKDSQTIQKRVAEALGAVGLRGYEKKVPFSLTKGERQRVAVASVLAAQPQVVILDEPTTGLDYPHQRSMMEMLKRLHGKGHTVIIITHSMWVAAEYAKRLIVLRDGSILLDGPTRHVFSEEKKLAEASLRPPPLVRLSNLLGTQALTVAQMVQELRT
ncbi:MAG: energy-coupling factor ABC transporter ATP-binding protein [Deltaproteobacteria bacterium]|nr:energy-coupling factor ABC transporter ATP-binding protein [Deltaproteobacteria bacterium]